MKVILAPDSFKGSLTAAAAAEAMAEGWTRVFPDAETVCLPVADGGEGTRAALVSATGGENIPVTVAGPVGQPHPACWGLLGDGETAVVELADAAGLTMVAERERDPKRTTTFGVGELLREAIRHPSVRRVIVGLGGSATNDAGAGLLTALGVRFLDAGDNPLGQGGASLAHLAAVDRSKLAIVPESIELLIACDVDNPLTGPRGASAIFGPQKGASARDVSLLDGALARFAQVTGFDPSTPGSGAAGGTAAGLLYLFPSARLAPGIQLVLDAVCFDAHLSGATLVLTGEGRLDGQTLGGKVIAGVGRRAGAAQVPVAALVGGLTPDIRLRELSSRIGVEAILPIVPGPCPLSDAMHNARTWLADAAERAAAWYRLGRTFA